MLNVELMMKGNEPMQSSIHLERSFREKKNVQIWLVGKINEILRSAFICHTKETSNYTVLPVKKN